MQLWDFNILPFHPLFGLNARIRIERNNQAQAADPRPVDIEASFQAYTTAYQM
jgi:hypothetical protein